MSRVSQQGREIRLNSKYIQKGKMGIDSQGEVGGGGLLDGKLLRRGIKGRGILSKLT